MVNLIANSGFQSENCTLSISDMKEHCGKRFAIKGCAILFVESGVAVCKVNYQRYAIRKGYLGIVFYDDIVVIERTSANFKCIVIMVPYNLVEEPIYKVTTSGLWNFIYRSPVFPLNDRQLFQIRTWWHQVAWVTNNVSENYRLEVLKNCIHNLLMVVDSELQLAGENSSSKEDNRARMLVTNFLELVAKHHIEYRDVTFYADKMCISASYLYKMTFKVLNVSPKSLIDKQVISAIKNYLMSTDLSVKNIAEQLHFKDASYMCRLFRRIEGLSPQEFRNKSTI